MSRPKLLFDRSYLHATILDSLPLNMISLIFVFSYIDAAKNDALELDGLGFMEDISGSLGCLLSPSLSKEPKCVESVIFSSFNPPPSYRR